MPITRSAAYRALDRVTRPSGLVLSTVLVIMLAAVTKPVFDPDFWWHLRAGQIILATHHLIPGDPFTYTVAGHSWTMHEWATEVSFAWLHSVGGLGLIIAVIAGVTWLGLLAIYMRTRLDRPNPQIAAASMIMAALVGTPIWGPRAQMITFALAALVLLLAERHLRNGGRAIWVLVPVFAAWSNLHGGFIIGIGFLLIIAVAELVGHWLQWPGSAAPSRARTLVFVAIAGLAAAVVNPNGPSILIYSFATQGSPVQQANIQEWASPNFHDWQISLLYAPMLLTLILAIILNRHLRAREVALVVTTVALSLQSVRHIALFVAVATPVWATQANLLLDKWRIHHPRRGAQRSTAPLSTRIAAYCIVMAVVSGAAASRVVVAAAQAEDSLAYAKDYPVCAVRWLATAPPNLKLFNQYGEGGYLAYKLSSRGDKVFAFGDAALMGDDLLTEYMHVSNVKWDWDAILAKYHTDIAVVDTGEPISNVLERSPRWVRLYADPKSAAFVRTDSPLRHQLPPQTALPTNSGDVCVELSRSQPDIGS